MPEPQIPPEKAAEWHTHLEAIAALAKLVSADAHKTGARATIGLRSDLSGIITTVDRTFIELRHLTGGYRPSERTLEALAEVFPSLREGRGGEPSTLERFIAGDEDPPPDAEAETRAAVFKEVLKALTEADGIGSWQEAAAVVRRLRKQGEQAAAPPPAKPRRRVRRSTQGEPGGRKRPPRR